MMGAANGKHNLGPVRRGPGFQLHAGGLFAMVETGFTNERATSYEEPDGFCHWYPFCSGLQASASCSRRGGGFVKDLITGAGDDDRSPSAGVPLPPIDFPDCVLCRGGNHHIDCHGGAHAIYFLLYLQHCHQRSGLSVSGLHWIWGRRRWLADGDFTISRAPTAVRLCAAGLRP